MPWRDKNTFSQSSWIFLFPGRRLAAVLLPVAELYVGCRVAVVGEAIGGDVSPCIKSEEVYLQSLASLACVRDDDGEFVDDEVDGARRRGRCSCDLLLGPACRLRAAAVLPICFLAQRTP